MKVDLLDTTTSKIAAALLEARRRAGSPAMGMVFTLIIVADETEQHDALKAAAEAAQEHPARVLAVILRAGRGAARLDAEVSVGGEAASGESVLMRFHGELARHAESVVMPLLLPESPVVAWWPGKPPNDLKNDPIGSLAQRRIADTAQMPRALTALRHLSTNYSPGDTDLAWTRLTPWRALLAASLDQHPARVHSAVVEAQRGNASATLLASWLRQRLKAATSLVYTKGPGITAVRLRVPMGEIAITRPDGRLAQYSVPGQPVRHVALKRRAVSELLAEELRRLDPDDVYADTVERFLKEYDAGTSTAGGASSQSIASVTPIGRRASAPDGPVPTTAADDHSEAAASARKSSAKNASAKKASVKKAAARKSTAKKASARKGPVKKSTAKMLSEP